MSDFGSIRNAAYLANMQIQEAGLVVLTWGNASAADHHAGVFAIKPSGVSYAKLSPENMVIVNIENGETVEGEFRPSSDTATHQRIYRAFDSVGGVVHTHSIHATAFAQASRPIPCYGTTHADHFDGAVPVGRPLSPDEIAENYEGATGDVIVEHINGTGRPPQAVPAILLPHHGPFTWGATASDAAKNAIALEAVAQMALDSMAIASFTGGEPKTTPPELLEKHQTRKHGPNAYYGQPDR